MNTRGIVQLVVLNIGVELGVISPKIFAIFVLMATILTLFTSPLLSLLYRKDYDIRKLSLPNIAADLRMVREEEKDGSESNEDSDPMETISSIDIDFSSAKRPSIKPLRKSSTGVHLHSTAVKFDDHINYADVDLNNSEQDSNGHHTTVHMTTSTPRRSICMTRF